MASYIPILKDISNNRCIIYQNPIDISWSNITDASFIPMYGPSNGNYVTKNSNIVFNGKSTSVPFIGYGEKMCFFDNNGTSRYILNINNINNINNEENISRLFPASS